MHGFYRRAIQCGIWAAAAGGGLPAMAQNSESVGSSFAIVTQPVAGDAVRTAKRNGELLKLDARPIVAVAIEEDIPFPLAVRFGAKQDVPFNRGMQLYGWPERPGLYCDLLRPRGLGLSAACLQDTDKDGRFDKGLRLDFNSARGDVLLITHSGKIIGAKFKNVTVPLEKPVAYSATAPLPGVTGALSVRWKSAPNKAGTAWPDEITVSTPGNQTDTEGLSEKTLAFDRRKVPLDVEIYGVKLRILGFDETGGMRYSVLGVTDAVPVPLFFRGYTLFIMII